LNVISYSLIKTGLLMNGKQSAKQFYGSTNTHK